MTTSHCSNCRYCTTIFDPWTGLKIGSGKGCYHLPYWGADVTRIRNCPKAYDKDGRELKPSLRSVCRVQS